MQLHCWGLVTVILRKASPVILIHAAPKFSQPSCRSIFGRAEESSSWYLEVNRLGMQPMYAFRSHYPYCKRFAWTSADFESGGVNTPRISGQCKLHLFSTATGYKSTTSTTMLQLTFYSWHVTIMYNTSPLRLDSPGTYKLLCSLLGRCSKYGASQSSPWEADLLVTHSFALELLDGGSLLAAAPGAGAGGGNRSPPPIRRHSQPPPKTHLPSPLCDSLGIGHQPSPTNTPGMQAESAQNNPQCTLCPKVPSSVTTSDEG